MTSPLNPQVLAQLFTEARTHNKWQAKDVPDSLLKQLVDLMKMAPTSANCSPARIIFLKSQAAKNRLKPFLAPANIEKTMTAPVTAIIAHDLTFYDHLPRLFPHADAKSWFVGKDEHIQTTAFRNGSLQGGYFMIAARALGLDVGGLSGFDNAALDAEYFAGTAVRSNFLCNLGYGDAAGQFPRSPRFAFDEIAKIL
jgi:3-hydroxypropanoate dehydrogenase